MQHGERGVGTRGGVGVGGVGVGGMVAQVAALDHSNAFELLAATILSAQSTDVGVNKATHALFAKVTTPQQMLDLGEEAIPKLMYAAVLPYLGAEVAAEELKAAVAHLLRAHLDLDALGALGPHVGDQRVRVARVEQHRLGFSQAQHRVAHGLHAEPDPDPGHLPAGGALAHGGQHAFGQAVLVHSPPVST